MNFSPKKSKESIAAAVQEARLKAAAKLEDLDTSLTLAVSRARLCEKVIVKDQVAFCDRATMHDQTEIRTSESQ